MDRLVLDRLMQVRDYPAVSVLCPTHRTYPDNRRDPIQLKELVREARTRLLAEFGWSRWPRGSTITTTWMASGPS